MHLRRLQGRELTLILLTGAGFSRNWGGWLANEVFEYVLGRPEVGNELRQRLWADKLRQRGFEETLGDIQQEAARGAPRTREMVDQFMAALVAMFHEMNRGLAAAAFEPQRSDQRYSVTTFLRRFDYIFTLNQDLALEHHYIPGMKGHCVTPGLVPIAQPDLVFGSSPDDPSTFKLAADKQPYIKLHGSSNWVRPGGSPLLVLGGGKEIEIRREPLLNWYEREFAIALKGSDAKLVVIGYSFSDAHVNRVIGQAAESGGLSLFIVDPNGVDVLDPWRDRPVHIRGDAPIRDQLSPHIRGASRRPLSATFGYDRVEHAKLMHFLGVPDPATLNLG